MMHVHMFVAIIVEIPALSSYPRSIRVRTGCEFLHAEIVGILAVRALQRVEKPRPSCLAMPGEHYRWRERLDLFASLRTAHLVYDGRLFANVTDPSSSLYLFEYVSSGKVYAWLEDIQDLSAVARPIDSYCGLSCCGGVGMFDAFVGRIR